MAIENTKLLVHDTAYWTGINIDVENYIEIVLHALILNKHNQRKKEFIMKFRTNHGK